MTVDKFRSLLNENSIFSFSNTEKENAFLTIILQNVKQSSSTRWIHFNGSLPLSDIESHCSEDVFFMYKVYMYLFQMNVNSFSFSEIFGEKAYIIENNEEYISDEDCSYLAYPLTDIGEMFYKALYCSYGLIEEDPYISRNCDHLSTYHVSQILKYGKYLEIQ